VATTLSELRVKVSVKFERAQPAIHLDCDGTEVDDEEYFSTLEPNAELIAVFPGEQWRDVSCFALYPGFTSSKSISFSIFHFSP